MILIGTMNWASTRMKGVFQCPECGGSQQFRLRASRPFLTLYFIPVLPIGGLQEYVECRNCKNSFESIILSNRMLPSDTPVEKPSAKRESDKTESNATNEPSFKQDLLNIIALMMIEDGHVNENEIKIARRLYENITEENISRDELGKACSQVQLQRLNTLSYLATASPRREHDERMLIVQAMFGVAGADGEITPNRMRSLMRAKDMLRLDEREFQTAIEATGQWLT